jgi:hypothetical protein
MATPMYKKSTLMRARNYSGRDNNRIISLEATVVDMMLKACESRGNKMSDCDIAQACSTRILSSFGHFIPRSEEIEIGNALCISNPVGSHFQI